MRKIFLTILSYTFIGVATCSTGLQQNKILNVDLYTVDNGLAQSTVTCIIQDSRGFLWIGTQDGLSRFDGYEFKNFRNDPIDTASIAYNYVNTLCEDSKGDIWVGTGTGLSRYIRRTGKFVNYYHNADDTCSISDNRIYSIYQDRQGTIWVKTQASLDKFVPKSNSFIRYPHYYDLLTFSAESNDFDIIEDSMGKLWVGSKDGLFLFDREKGKFKRYFNDPSNPKSLSNNKVKDILEDSRGNLWIATEFGLNLYDSRFDNFIKYFHNSAQPNSIRSNVVNTLFEDSNGLLWVGTDVGFSCYNRETNTFINFHNVVNNGKVLQSQFITSFCEDNSHILWIGSYLGLIKYDTKGAKFKLYNKSNTGENLFSNNFISSIFKDINNNIWVGTWGSGLHIYNPITRENIHYSLKSTNKICNDNVHVIFQKKNNDILIGTRDGIEVYNPNSKSFQDYFARNGIDSKGVFNANRVYAITEDVKGNLWVASKLGLYKIAKNRIISYQHVPTDSNSLSSSECYDVIIDNEGLVWVGTFNGLNCINPENETVKRFYKTASYTGKELISNEIICLHQDSEGFIWVGTSSGLHKFNKNTTEFKLYTEQSGLPNNLIYSMEEDRNGQLWISTNWGIASLNLKNDLITAYDVNDGLQSHEFNINSSCNSWDGEIFFGGINGFNSFYPDSIKFNDIVPKIAITDFEVITRKGKESFVVDGLDGLVLPTDFNTVTIQFAALDFTRTDKNLYEYKLDGLYNSWVDLGRKRVVTLSNLKPGEYTLRIKGSNNDKIWNTEGVKLKIKVITRFWQSTLAYIIYSGLFALGLFVFVRIVNRKYRETTSLLRERELVLVEMEEHRQQLMLKNKNITDSINYAKRIQEAIMPSLEYFKKLLPDSFILYMPKDIVSGDFYWVNETKNKIFVAVIDCTGHGVPGAFMSIIGVELLRNITNIQGIDDAAEILNRLNTGINDTFRKGITDDIAKVKDGMDVAFCVIDKENNILQYSGAFSDLYLIRDNKVTEIKGDRYSVGMGNDTNRQFFSSHYVPVHPTDMIYIFTDGYVDQFGGPDGKKYKFRRFRHLLLNIHKFPLETQRQYLEESILEWKGNHDQVDDVLVIGIKPDLSCLF